MQMRRLEQHPADVDMPGMLALLCTDLDDLAGAKKWSAIALAAKPDNLDGLIAGGTLALADDGEGASGL
jgi:hypothetical protein